MSIVLLEKKLSSLDLQPKQDSFSTHLTASSNEINDLVKSLANVSINKYSADLLKYKYQQKFEKLKAKTYTQKNPFESLDLATPSSPRKADRPSLDYLDLNLSCFTTCENSLYESLRPVDKKAKELESKSIVNRLQEAFECYVYPTLSVVADASPKVLDEKCNVYLPKHTTFFVKEKFNKANYQTKFLASGVFGEVHKLSSRNLDKIFAIKIPGASERIKSSETIKAIRNEASVLLQIQHPNIISISAITDLKAHGTCLIMNFIEGNTLSKELGKLGYSHQNILKHAKELASAINYLHQKGLVHKDIKPDNIMINKDNQAILLDFGLARKKDHSQEFSGSFYYIAPELHFPSSSSSSWNDKLDVYAFGVTLYEILSSGEGPYPQKTSKPKKMYDSRVASSIFLKPCILKEIQKHLDRDKLILFSQRDPSGKLTEILVNCLHGDPAKRPSMQKVVEMLERI